MSTTRSGQERRANWPPPEGTCEKHSDLAVSIAKVETTVKTSNRNWALILGSVWTIGIAIIAWSANRAISLAENVTKLDTQIQLSAADRKVIHEEIKAINARVGALETICQRPTGPFQMRTP